MPDLGVSVRTFEGWEQHWLHVKKRLDIRAAALSFLFIVVMAVTGLGCGADHIERFYYEMNITVNHRDVRQMNLQDDQVLQAYLRGKPQHGINDCVVIGSSLTATIYDYAPHPRLQQLLESKMETQTGEQWACTNLATANAVTWTYFYMARLLRLYRPPKVLVVGMDLDYPRDRNPQLVLNVGRRGTDLTSAELSCAVPYNRQLLFISESNANKWLRDNLPVFRALHFATYSYPLRHYEKPWLSYMLRTVVGMRTPSTDPAGCKPDGTPKSWLEQPDTKARIELFQSKGGVPQIWDERMPGEYDMLFAELQRCQAAGIQVIVLSMPRNPAVKQLLGPMQDCVKQTAARHGVAFHDYWLSGMIPEQYFIDTGHFFGRGSEIMADEIARLITCQPLTATAGGR